MRLQAIVAFVSILFTIATARANNSAIAACGPNDGYVTLYTSVETFEMAARLACGTRLEIVESQNSYAAQHTKYLRVATADGKLGYVARSAVAFVNDAPPTRSVAPKSASPVPATFAAKAAARTEVRLLDGTELSVRLTNDLSSENVREGDTIGLGVAEPLVRGDATVFERGAAAHARITHIKPASRWGHQGEIFWALQDVTAVDGTVVPARFVGESEPALGIPPSGILAASGNTQIVEQPTFSLHKGSAAWVPAGQIFRIYLKGDTVIRLVAPQSIAPHSTAQTEP